MEKTYQTRNLLTADANGTRVIRTKGNSDGELGFITVLADTAHTIAFYDGIDNTGDLIFTKPASLAVGTYWIKRPLVKGLCAVVQASFAGNIVVGYN
jgi:hypothetical protein